MQSDLLISLVEEGGIRVRGTHPRLAPAWVSWVPAAAARGHGGAGGISILTPSCSQQWENSRRGPGTWSEGLPGV